MKEQVKALWKLCFDDSDQFIEMYFNLRYTDEINIAIESDDKVVAALQMIPYPMTFCNHMVSTSYISGACTHPDFRGNGIMSKLLLKVFTEMWTKDVLFSTLIPAEPWLFSYYERLGYAPVFYYSTEDVIVPDSPSPRNITVTTISEYDENIYHYLNKKLAERPCCIQHTPEDFKIIVAGLAINDEILFIAKQNHEVYGIAIVYQEDNHIIINEMFADSKDIELNLLYYISHYTNCRHLTLLKPPTDTISHSLGMARIINAKEVLQLYSAAFPKNEMQIELSDEQLSANNGYYSLYQGKCIFSKMPRSTTYSKLTISELTKRILTPLQPYMSLMMN